MKKKKLTIRKETIAKLNNEESRQLNAGLVPVSAPCVDLRTYDHSCIHVMCVKTVTK
ncbi:MAG: class I lanthipeptide [Hyphomicrobiales bacterium]